MAAMSYLTTSAETCVRENTATYTAKAVNVTLRLLPIHALTWECAGSGSGACAYRGTHQRPIPDPLNLDVVEGQRRNNDVENQMERFPNTGCHPNRRHIQVILTIIALILMVVHAADRVRWAQDARKPYEDGKTHELQMIDLQNFGQYGLRCRKHLSESKH